VLLGIPGVNVALLDIFQDPAHLLITSEVKTYSTELVKLPSGVSISWPLYTWVFSVHAQQQ
jgi:hypothetical protein